MNNLRTLLGQYAKHLLVTTNSRNFVGTSRRLETFFARYQDRTDPGEFCTADFEEHRDYRLAQGIKPSTVKGELSALRSFFQWLIEVKEQPLFNPLGKIEVPTPPKSPVSYETISPEDLEKVFAVCDTNWDRLIIWLGLSGMTAREISEGKFDRILRAEARELLGAYKPVTAQAVTGRWRFLVDKAGVTRKTFDCLQDTLAVEILRHGGSLLHIQFLCHRRSLSQLHRYLPQTSEAQTQKSLESLSFVPQNTVDDHPFRDE